jgi:hypothetical protein
MRLVILIVVMAAVSTIMVRAWRLHAQGSVSALRKVFEHHQQQESPEVKVYYPAAGGEAFVLSRRWKNYQKQACNCPAIAEVVSVQIGKTSDTGNYVITMRGPNAGKKGLDGFELDTCSLWINGGEEDKRLEVRDFTNY